MTSQMPAPVAPGSHGLLSLATESLSDRQLLEHFQRRHDDVAFEALVQRHGPMVLGVCRRVLGNEADAEDAFQATFMVLARKAGSISKPDLLAGWLFGVASRIARKARAQTARRRRLEAEGGHTPMSPPDPLLEAAWQDLRALLDEELQRLPAKYQAPLVLCYLEGMTNEEAARQLGWPSGSMSYRLARGRELLRERLSRRNRSVPPALLSTLLTAAPVLSDLPSGLVQGTVRAALSHLAGKTAATAGASPAVTNMVDQAVKAIPAGRRGKWMYAWTILVALALAASAAAYTAAGGKMPFGLSSGYSSNGACNSHFSR